MKVAKKGEFGGGGASDEEERGMKRFGAEGKRICQINQIFKER